MKVTLILPYVDDAPKISTTLYPPMGLLYLAANIQDIVEEVTVLDANVLEMKLEQVLNYNKVKESDVVGISINMMTEKIAVEIAIEIKKRLPNITLVGGGPSATTNPKKYLDSFDVVIAGEGEIPFRRIIEQLNTRNPITDKCHGVIIDGSRISQADHPELDDLPFPAYQCLQPGLEYYSRKARIIKPLMAPLLTSRGCPYSCAFCDKSVHGNSFRPRSVESVLNEIRWLYDEYGVRQIDILDDNFTFDIQRAEHILNGIISIGKIAINCQNGLRADRVNENLVKKMKATGVFRVGIGIESGNEKTIRSINKHLDLDTVKQCIALFRKYHITVHGFFIIGLPSETEEDILNTINFAVKLNPHFANFSRYMPIVGTPLYEQLETKNQLTNSGENSFFSLNSPIKYDTISTEKVRELYKKAWIKFYLRPYKLFDILISVKSYKEFLWILRLGFSVLKNLLFTPNTRR